MVHRTTQMNIDHQKLFEPLTKATYRLNPHNAASQIERALKLCLEEYPGPVHIGLPSDIAGCEINSHFAEDVDKNIITVKNESGKIENILSSSKNPVIALGLTASRLKSGNRLNQFLQKFKIPVVLTPMAKGIISEDHPCYAGVLFHVLSDYLDDIISRCDLVIGLGYDPVEYNYESWIPEVPLVHFSTRETDLPESVEAFQYTGTKDEWFDILERSVSRELIPDFSGINAMKKDMKAVFEGFTSHFGPVAAVRILMDELPDNTVLTSDVGSHLHLIGQYWKTRGHQNLIITNGWSGMGFGIPAAIAVSLIDQSNTVACVTGDGGFLMMAGEIITARRNNLPVLFIVLSDGELNLIKLKKSWQNLSSYGTNLYSGELFGSDTFLGVRVINVETSESMRQALSTARKMNQPVIINARIDPEDYKWLIVRR
jgi:acetolactate synthase-1/2/3 large subunit